MKKLIHYEKLYDALHRIRFSGYRVVETKGVTWELDFLLSRFKSRRTVEVRGGHGIDNLVVFRNYDDVVAVSSRKPEQEEHVVSLRTPAEWFRDLFVFPIQMPMWAQVGKIVWAILPDRFVGFDKNGKPIFDERADCWFGWGDERYLLKAGNFPSVGKMREELYLRWIALAEDEQAQYAEVIARWLRCDESAVLEAARKELTEVDEGILKLLYEKYILKQEA